MIARRRRSISRGGFTLLETILAVALSALLIALIGAGMRIYTKTVADRRADVVNAQVARSVLQFIARDLRASYTVTESEDSSSSIAGDDELGDLGSATSGGAGSAADAATADSSTDTSEFSSDEELVDATVDLTGSTAQSLPGIYGNQYELQIDVLGQFPIPVKYDMAVAAGTDLTATNLLSDPKVVTYYTRAIDESELSGTVLESVGDSSSDARTILARRIQSRAVAISSQESGLVDIQTGEQLLSDQVVTIQFAYHDGYEWLESWSTSEMGGLPIAVNITVTVANQAGDNTVTVEQTFDNTFQLTVRVPTAELPAEDTTAI